MVNIFPFGKYFQLSHTCPFNRKHFPQMSHLCSFLISSFGWCKSLCCLRYVFCENLVPQISQTNGFSPENCKDGITFQFEIPLTCFISLIWNTYSYLAVDDDCRATELQQFLKQWFSLKLLDYQGFLRRMGNFEDSNLHTRSFINQGMVFLRTNPCADACGEQG